MNDDKWHTITVPTHFVTMKPLIGSQIGMILQLF